MTFSFFSLALKIHCSEKTKEALSMVEGFLLDERGIMQIKVLFHFLLNKSFKGRGLMRTFFLLEREGYDFEADNESTITEDQFPSEIFPRPSMKNRVSSSWSECFSRYFNYK